MARLFTFYDSALDSAYPGATGITTVYPFVADLTTEDGYRQMDVAIAARFRITEWHITGTMGSGSLHDSFDDTQGTLSIANEWFFAITGALPPDSPGLLNGQLQIQSSGSWANFDLANTSLGARISSGLAAIHFRFQAVGPVTSISADSVNDGVSHSINIGSVTVRVPAWGGATGFHSLTTTLWGSNAADTANFLIEPSESLEYADSDGIPVWDFLTAAALLDPADASVSL